MVKLTINQKQIYNDMKYNGKKFKFIQKIKS